MSNNYNDPILEEMLFKIFDWFTEIIQMMRAGTPIPSRQEALPTTSSLRKRNSSNEALPQSPSQRKRSSFANFFRSRKDTKTIQSGEEDRARMQFLALYQVKYIDVH